MNPHPGERVARDSPRLSWRGRANGSQKPAGRPGANFKDVLGLVPPGLRGAAHSGSQDATLSPPSRLIATT